MVSFYYDNVERGPVNTKNNALKYVHLDAEAWYSHYCSVQNRFMDKHGYKVNSRWNKC